MDKTVKNNGIVKMNQENIALVLDYLKKVHDDSDHPEIGVDFPQILENTKIEKIELKKILNHLGSKKIIDSQFQHQNTHLTNYGLSVI